MPSAFQLLVRAGDYIAADTVANDSPPEAFNSPGLRGWRAAARGFLYPERAVEEFTRAANEFAANTREESLKHTGHWTSANVDLWAKYFRARAYVSQVAQTPDQTSALLKQARDALKGTESGWGNPQVTCFRFLLTILDQALDPDGHDSVDDLRESFISRMRFSGLDETDHLALQFFDRITAGFADLRAGPRIALISDNLSTALNALVRIPLFGSGEARELSAQIGMQAETVLLGNVRTWMHRTLSSISDEIVLQKVLLYLIQAELPLFAQNRQGVAEYGKDIVELVALGGQNVLKMYQVKAGDITVPKWRAARAELEDMFLADMSDVQLPATPDVREGILIYNGHILPLTEPLVEGWLKEQKCDHDRTFTIMGLDDIVTWIVDHRLVSEFRAILTALGIPIT